VMVPYMFCTDNQRDLNPDCMLWDAGADAYESVKSIVDSYWYYYPLISFARQRVGFDVGPVVDRVHSRYFEKVKRAHQIYALYRPTFADIFGVAPDDTEFWTKKNAIGGWSGAADLGFRLLKNVITAPEPGGYSARTQPDGSQALVPSTAQFNQFSVSPVDGRFLETTWNNDAGYYWGEQLQRVGYFYDKVLAIMTLVDPTTYFVGRDTDSDIRKWQISYTASFANPIQELFRGILSEDWGAIAPRLDDTGRVIYPGISQLEKRTMAGTPLFPNVSFSIQLYAAVFGMGYIPQTYDQTFINSSRVWVQGGAEEIVFAPEVPLVTFTDPTSKLTYVAESFVDAEGVEHGVGASMLAYANEMIVTAAGDDEILGTADDSISARDAARKFIDNIDVVRRLTWQLGFGAQP
jgi:hypothetical protein